ncbi:hypothetical protein EIN_052790 [Entamoeba invadens IP1]|uniref:hypothetical protein n=1 Tax=Entamoeba invadens IP1 TaxID=370355 RepID=UPI0002C3DF6C|nr:hypothetical protein EIN_052790 [Entamoeba invadens IP1]ELP93064.1 hypothetical protein EIN_052790 [Entamoeba invadens IP1]|eukprot:XP_004259835.1 hypothetical protein EIN_052790 [Entamoeba invadens IP1]
MNVIQPTALHLLDCYNDYVLENDEDDYQFDMSDDNEATSNDRIGTFNDTNWSVHDVIIPPRGTNPISLVLSSVPVVDSDNSDSVFVQTADPRLCKSTPSVNHFDDDEEFFFEDEF